jgi:hypothetical protein
VQGATKNLTPYDIKVTITFIPHQPNRTQAAHSGRQIIQWLMATAVGIVARAERVVAKAEAMTADR